MAATVDMTLANPAEIPFHLRLGVGSKNVDSPQSTTTTPREDPLRILLPAQKKLSTIESQRVLAAINGTSRRLEAALVIPSMVKSLEHLSVPLGSELVALLREYADFAVGFEDVVDTSSSLNICSSQSFTGDSTGGSKISELLPVDSVEEERLSVLRKNIRHCVKSILRHFSANPSILQTVHRKRVAHHIRLMECFQGLCSVSNEMLLTTRMEEMKRREHLQMVTSRRQSMEDTIRKLESELATAQSQKDQEVCSTLWSCHGNLQLTVAILSLPVLSLSLSVCSHYI